MKTKIFLARHGQTEASVKGIVQGQGLNIPLTAEGEEQAEILAKNLSNLSFNKIFTSTAIRSTATAETIKKYHQDVHLYKLAELNERSKGKTEGMLKEDFNKRYPNIVDKWDKEIDVRVADGESFKDVEKRIVPVIEKHIKEYAGQILLYVIHGNVIRAILGYILGIPYGLRARIKQGYCAFNVVSYEHDRQRWEIELINRVFKK